MKNNEIGVGIIGAGKNGWAARSHLPALKRLEKQFVLAAVSTSDINSARESAEKFGVPNAFDNEYDLVHSAEVDLVVVAVKVPSHYQLVKAALDAGKMVYCEWPLGNGTAEARELCEIADRKGIKTFAGLQSHALPELQYLKEFLLAGKIGKVLSSTILGTGDNWGTVLPDKSLSYLLDPKTGANMMTIPFAHAIDGLQFVLGGFDEVSALTARRKDSVVVADTGAKEPLLVDDQIIFNGTLNDGTVCSAHFRGGSNKGDNLFWEIRGDKGMVVITSPIGHLQFGKLDIRVVSETGISQPFVIPELYHASEGGGPGIGADLSRAVYYAYKQIASDIKHGTTIYPSFKYALDTHEFLDQVSNSANSGNRVALKNR
jgi:predicted dehydrogenase